MQLQKGDHTALHRRVIGSTVCKIWPFTWKNVNPLYLFDMPQS